MASKTQIANKALMADKETYLPEYYKNTAMDYSD